MISLGASVAAAGSESRRSRLLLEAARIVEAPAETLCREPEPGGGGGAGGGGERGGDGERAFSCAE